MENNIDIIDVFLHNAWLNTPNVDLINKLNFKTSWLWLSLLLHPNYQYQALLIAV